MPTEIVSRHFEGAGRNVKWFRVRGSIVLRVEGCPEMCFVEHDVCVVFVRACRNGFLKFVLRFQVRTGVHAELAGITFRCLLAIL